MFFKNRQIKISPVRMQQVLFFLTLFALIVPNVALCFTERLGLWGSVCNIVLPLGAYSVALMAFRKVGRAVWMLFPFLFLAAFQLVLLYLFGKSIIGVDMFLNLVTTNAAEASELLDNLIPAVSTVVLIYVPTLVLATISAFGKAEMPVLFMRKARVAGFATFVSGCVVTALCSFIMKDYRVKDDLYPVNVCYNLYLAIQQSWRAAHYEETSRNFSFHAKATHPKDSTEVYVLVIGETARACEFSLYGYSRPTTPRLSRTDGVTAFSDALTQSNTTHRSVPMLLSAASAGDHERLVREKGVIAAFREAGFHTTFISNQRRNNSYIDFLGEEADDCRFIKDDVPDDSNILDGELVRLTAEVLAKKRRKELIVLHTYGSHFNYRERYPRSQAYFRPDDATEARRENRPSLINAYDNSIRYTDLVLSRLISLMAERHVAAALMYTSDHGENIFDDSRGLFLHASPTASRYELHVPLIVWTSDRYREDYPQICEALARNKKKTVQTSVSVFYTMLQMAGITTHLFVPHSSVASPTYRCGEIRYLSDREL